MTPHAIRIVSADDHALFRDALRRLLEVEPGFTVVGEAACGGEAVRLSVQLAPDVLLLDLAMPDLSGVGVLSRLADAGVAAKAVIVTAAIETSEVVEALRLGAKGVLLKTSAATLLHKCVRAVDAGGYWLWEERLPDMSAALRRLTDHHSRPRPIDTLTTRELEIISAIVGGASTREIARQLEIAEQTLKKHLGRIFDKVGVSTRLELVVSAVHHGLIGVTRDVARAMDGATRWPVREQRALATPSPTSDPTRGEGAPRAARRRRSTTQWETAGRPH